MLKMCKRDRTTYEGSTVLKSKFNLFDDKKGIYRVTNIKRNGKRKIRGAPPKR